MSHADSGNENISVTASAVHETKSYGDFLISVWENASSREEHVVLVKGSVAGCDGVLCRIQSECLTGTVLDAATCECKEQLDCALEMIHGEAQGVVILLRQEGRGHGLTHKIRALANKNAGYDTFEAVEMLGDKADIRTYDDAVAILRRLKVASVCLLTNNPAKVNALSADGVTVQRVLSLNIPPTTQTIKHLRAKKKRGHDIRL